MMKMLTFWCMSLMTSSTGLSRPAMFLYRVFRLLPWMAVL